MKHETADEEDFLLICLLTQDQIFPEEEEIGTRPTLSPASRWMCMAMFILKCNLMPPR
jgi:hypothetical protein